MGIISTSTTAFSGLRWQSLALDSNAATAPGARATSSKRVRNNFAHLMPHTPALADRPAAAVPSRTTKVGQTSSISSFMVINGAGFAVGQDVPAPVHMSDPGPTADSTPTPVRMLDPGPQADSVPAPVRMFDPGPQADSTPTPVRMLDPGPQADSVPAPVRMFDPGPQPDSTPTPVRMLDPGPPADIMTSSSLFRRA